MAKNAQAYERGEDILLNLLLWAKRNLGMRIISDYEMSAKGERAWQLMAANAQLNIHIYNFDQDRIYELNDPAAVRPELDHPIDDQDTTWFYIMEAQILDKFGLCESHHNFRSLVQPYYYSDHSIPDGL